MLTPEERDRSTAVRRGLNRALDAIAADKELSPAGKRIRRSQAQLAAERDIKAIRQAAEARQQQARRDSYFKAFGLKSTSADAVLADRDARQFAAQLDSPGEALRALAAAELRGDVSLARAIAERAWQHRGGTDAGGHWEQVVSSYAQASPDRNRALGDLAEATAPSSFSDRMYTDPPARPADIYNAEALAAQAEPQTVGA